MLLPLQGVTNERALPQGVASLALGYALIGLSARPWVMCCCSLLCIIGCTSAIQVNLIAFGLRDNSWRVHY